MKIKDYKNTDWKDVGLYAHMEIINSLIMSAKIKARLAVTQLCVSETLTGLAGIL